MQKENKSAFDELFLLAISRLEHGDSISSIEPELRKKCDDVVLIAVVLKEASNAHYVILRRQGFRLIFIGCIVGLCGFLITLFNFNTSRSIHFAMYGLTTAGLLIVFRGVYKILG